MYVADSSIAKPDELCDRQSTTEHGVHGRMGRILFGVQIGCQALVVRTT